MKKMDATKSIAVMASAAFVLLVGGLFIQHLRHSWPFSLHHGVGMPLPSTLVAGPDGGSVPTSHPRAEIQIPQSSSTPSRAHRKGQPRIHHPAHSRPSPPWCPTSRASRMCTRACPGGSSAWT